LYLFHGRHFDIAAIGRYAWIPFFVAGLGNIAGGLIVKGFLYCKLSVTNARKAAVTLAAVLMTAAIPAVLVPGSGLSIALVSLAMAGYTAALGEHAGNAFGRFSSPGRRISVWPCEHGIGVGRHGVRASYRVASGPLFVHSGLLALRTHSVDLRCRSVDLDGFAAARIRIP
jgi:hypothetical protein